MIAEQVYSLSIPWWVAVPMLLAFLGGVLWLLTRTGHVVIEDPEPDPVLVEGTRVSLNAYELDIWMDVFTARTRELVTTHRKDGVGRRIGPDDSAEKACEAVLWFRREKGAGFYRPDVAAGMHAWVVENAESA